MEADRNKTEEPVRSGYEEEYSDSEADEGRPSKAAEDEEANYSRKGNPSDWVYCPPDPKALDDNTSNSDDEEEPPLDEEAKTMSTAATSAPASQPSLNEEEELLKRNFRRFMRMVEQKQLAVQRAIQEQERLVREQRRLRPAGEDRVRVEAEACFEMLKKKKPSAAKVKKYQALLEADFAAHKIVVCAYQSSILKTVQTLTQAANGVSSATNKRRPPQLQ